MSDIPIAGRSRGTVIDVWALGTKDSNGLWATAHASEKAALDYLRSTYHAPADVADDALCDWLQESSGIEVSLGRDEVTL